MKRSVLLVRPGALGDTILTLPLLLSLRDRHPSDRITFLGSRAYRDLIPADFRFECFDDPSWTWLFAEASTALPKNAESFDAAYLVLNSTELPAANLRRAGTNSVAVVSSVPPARKHLVEHLHEGLGLPVPAPKPCLKHLATWEPGDFLWVHPGSGGKAKCAPLSLFLELIDEWRSGARARITVTVGDDDAFLHHLPEWDDLVSLPGTTLLTQRPLVEVCRKLGAAQAFIGNDSGMAHLAAGLGIPCTIIFTATDPAQWRPWVPMEQLTVRALKTALDPESPA